MAVGWIAVGGVKMEFFKKKWKVGLLESTRLAAVTAGMAGS
jgi:hypothetical protein